MHTTEYTEYTPCLSMSSDSYSHFLTRPVWPKAHRTKLQDNYKASTADELASESDRRRHHHPLKASITSGNRAAGTSGALYEPHGHPDDFDRTDGLADEELAAALDKHISKEGEVVSRDERERLLKTIRDVGKPEQVREDFKKLLDDPNIVISARDVKDLTPDYAVKEDHAKMHGWARYIMPVGGLSPYALVFLPLTALLQRMRYRSPKMN